jgi:hypothetical protein
MSLCRSQDVLLNHDRIAGRRLLYRCRINIVRRFGCAVVDLVIFAFILGRTNRGGRTRRLWRFQSITHRRSIRQFEKYIGHNICICSFVVGKAAGTIFCPNILKAQDGIGFFGFGFDPLGWGKGGSFSFSSFSHDPAFFRDLFEKGNDRTESEPWLPRQSIQDVVVLQKWIDVFLVFDPSVMGFAISLCLVGRGVWATAQKYFVTHQNHIKYKKLKSHNFFINFLCAQNGCALISNVHTPFSISR